MDPPGQQAKSPLDFFDRWGAVSEAIRRDEVGGVEKRLECDFRDEYRGDLDWQSVLESVGLPVRGAMVSEDVSCFLCDRAIVIAMAQKIILTAAHDVAIHEFVGPLVAALHTAGIVVEWASFMKKSTTSPWQTKNQTLALEYAHLKSTFPKGNPFIFGQVDGDHYFYFVSDTIERFAGVRSESDVQINIVMYNIDESRVPKPHLLFGSSATVVYRLDSHEFQGATFQGKVYEHLRLAGTQRTGRFLSYETNAELTVATRRRFHTLVDASRPQRFTVLLLMDPESESARHISASTLSSLDFVGTFDGFEIENKIMNEFEAGYFVAKVSFARQAAPIAE